ncbi:hypothetical protein BGZ74_002864, partial [Mortierella antarctica]
MGCPSQIRRLEKLQRLYLPETTTIQPQQMVQALRESSLGSLEALGVNHRSVSARGVVPVLDTFPNLKEVDLGSVRIYSRGGREVDGALALTLDLEPC